MGESWSGQSLRALAALGNLHRMNRRRLIGLVIVALLAAWPVLRSCTPDEPEPERAPPPVREAFHASKPIRVQVSAVANADGKTADVAWLDHELRQLLSRGKMRVAPPASDNAVDAFTLQIELTPDATQAKLSLSAPDRVVERQEIVPLASTARLDTLSAIAARLPQFLGVTHASASWTSLIGIDNARAYETFLNGSMELLGPASEGYTRPPAATQRARTVERLESLTRNQPRFARAWGALAIGYLSLGGRDQASLAQLAKASAERALSLDPETANAQAALGLVHLRRNEWVAAREQFDRALTLDASNAPALEGLACLLADVGSYQAARPLAEHASSLQPRKSGAQECLAYASVEAVENTAHGKKAQSSAVARVRALRTMLAGDLASASKSCAAR